MENDPRIRILTGHFGSGKTEIAINLALLAAKQHKQVAIADMDVINPYFRSREAANLFLQHGIELIAPKGRLATSDLPVVSGELQRVLIDPAYHIVIDAGGDKDGATSLGQFSNEIRKLDYQMLFVVNANRPYVSTPEGVIDTIRRIEEVTRLRVSGLINNTHLGKETTLAVVEKGADLARQVSAQLGIPFLFTTVEDSFCKTMNALSNDVPCLPLIRYMKLPWE